ncbi:hypothetical protein NQZ68_015584 [Dissostichus eleginoides]|nr:hypothetical protein NQZ68_015584 [Dissostichus eleginoides]
MSAYIFAWLGGRGRQQQASKCSGVWRVLAVVDLAAGLTALGGFPALKIDRVLAALWSTSRNISENALPHHGRLQLRLSPEAALGLDGYTDTHKGIRPPGTPTRLPESHRGALNLKEPSAASVH